MEDDGKVSHEIEVRRPQQAANWYEGSTLVRAVVSAIPTIGGPLDLILSGGASARAKRRVDEFIEDLRARIEKLDNRVASFPDEDGLVDVIRHALNRVAVTRTAEKRHRFANIFLHQALKGSPLSEIEDAVDLLDRLTDIDISVLTVGISGADLVLPGGVRVVCLARRRSAQVQEKTGSLSSALPDVSPEALTLSCAKLLANGLFLDEGVNRLDVGAFEYFRPTELASWFVAWICEVEPH